MISDEEMIGLNGFVHNYYYERDQRYYDMFSEVANDMMSFAYRYLRDGAAEAGALAA